MNPALARLLASGPPIGSDAWSLGVAGLELILDQLDAGRVEVVECGSGLSTIVIARRLRELGGGHVHSLEHDPQWARLTAQRIAAEELGDRATVIEAPLADNPAAEPGCRWYRREALGELPARGIELLVVDGPPAGEPAGSRSRYPALPGLAPRLTADAAVILDDVRREGERWVLQRWEAELGVSFERRGEQAIAIGVCCDRAPEEQNEAHERERTPR